MYVFLYNGGRLEMNNMITRSATDVRKEWSMVIDNAVREKPQFIRRTRDYMMLADIEFLKMLLEPYVFTAKEFKESDGTVTLELCEMDLVSNGATREIAIQEMAKEIIDYSEDFYNNFNLWSIADNRKSHIPYVFKALIFNDVEKIGELILCQLGKS